MGRDQERLDKALSEIEGGENVKSIVFDVRDTISLFDKFEQAISLFCEGKIDILVN